MEFRYIKQLLVLAGLVLMVGFSFQSCKKPAVTSEDFLAANISVFNGWNNEDEPELTFHLDTSHKLHSGKLYYGRQLDYLVVYAGNRTAKFKQDDHEIFSKAINLESKKVYSLFLTGKKGSPEAILAEDDIVNMSPIGKFRIRVANIATDGYDYELRYAKEGSELANATTLLPSTTQKTISAYKQFSSDPNYQQKFNIWAIAPGKDTLVTDLVSLASEGTYTVIVSGGKKSNIGHTSLSVFKNLLPFF